MTLKSLIPVRSEGDGSETGAGPDQEDRYQGGSLNADGRCAVLASSAPLGLISIKVAGLGCA
jgi:hypothetical protein